MLLAQVVRKQMARDQLASVPSCEPMGRDLQLEKLVMGIKLRLFEEFKALNERPREDGEKGPDMRSLLGIGQDPDGLLVISNATVSQYEK